MTTYALPLLATAAAFGLTYVFCIRPMRTGRACHTPATYEQPEAEVSALREEVARLRREIEAHPVPAGPLHKADPR
ncbi:hypothetical protein ACFV7R_16180 [Streptomyces sp. NPDC059866]|uniref:hypothetical protein n=1 Tax=Streptomyces sp. NPDC059866 TaxID=3346978 RepID=UPI00364A2950